MRTYKVTNVVFDTDGDYKLAGKLLKKYVGTTVNVEDDELSEDEAQDEAMDTVTEISGWCILGIEFEKVN